MLCFWELSRMPTLDAEDIRWVREGGFEPGAIHARTA